MSSDKRKHHRLSQKETIFIELASAGFDDDDEAEVALCKTVNISHSGLQVKTNRELKVGAILQIGVELATAQDTLYLAAQVVWCKCDEEANNSWAAGLELMNANDSDIETWRSALNKMAESKA